MIGEKGGFVLEPEAVKLLKQYKIPYPKHGLARNAKETVAIADRLGYPVVLKVVSPDVLHKSDAGGVLVGLENAKQARAGYGLILDRVQTSVADATITGVLVCKQAGNGVEAIVGAVEDPVFGPTLMFGLGGIFTELLRDVSFRIAPIERLDAEEMVKEIKGYPLLTGMRGQPGCDVNRLIDLLMAVSKMVTDKTEIRELDLNPVRLFERGLMVLDVRLVKRESL
jgi:acyl-CoA synthetase (NDP forming)